MKKSFQILNSYEYKNQFLPDVNKTVLYDNSKLQLYRIENYLKRIKIPVPPYRTTFNFLIFITKGYVIQQIEDENYKIECGEIINVKQGSITRTHELSQDAEGFYLIYENEIITSISLSTQDLMFFSSDPFIKIPQSSHSWMIKIFELLEEELHTESPLQETCNAVFTAILSKIIALTTHSPLTLAREMEITHRFRELLQKQYKEHKDVFFYAWQLNISGSYLNKCVKKATGKPPKQWIHEVCILQSKILLKDLGHDISDVANILDFQSLSHFSRIFKKITGQSPSAFCTEIKK
ncbi:AraC family transcriptional regulator [Flavobacterium ginsengiterrae]|uniref:AraC family transcriptional regulator n=1 Tax=Flavobacterium ginsengiterrae TaxID=871695 RepID=A0ABP7H0R0_9FLAO